ncbi:DUF3159 domain-containing protein [Thalassiella azotivora]
MSDHAAAGRHDGRRRGRGDDRGNLGRRARAGIAAATAEEFSVRDAVGGPRGVVEAVLPGLLFVLWFTATQDLRASLVAAVAASVVAVVVRVATGGTVMSALSGLVGVGVCAFVAARTGEARDFYLPGLLINVGYAVVYTATTLPTPAFTVRLRRHRWRVPRGPWPVFGLLLGPLLGEGLAWKHDQRRLRAYVVVTWLWVGMFVTRLVVQLPLFLADAVGPLGAARLAMGVPFFALTAFLSWRVLRAVPLAVAAPAADDAGTPSEDGADRAPYADPDGYGADGYAADGYEADAYQPEGYAVDGYEAHGYEADGYQPEGYAAEGYEPDGYEADPYPADATAVHGAVEPWEDGTVDGTAWRDGTSPDDRWRDEPWPDDRPEEPWDEVTRGR